MALFYTALYLVSAPQRNTHGNTHLQEETKKTMIRHMKKKALLALISVQLELTRLSLLFQLCKYMNLKGGQIHFERIGQNSVSILGAVWEKKRGRGKPEHPTVI